ncbi:MAG: sulfur carrier protein ThiS [Pseudomonadota bacterium]|jgi:sulfur carrier protein
MIEIVLNGAPRQFDAVLTVAGLLEREGLLGKRVAVEKNGEIVPKSLHATTPVAAGDQLEIVVAVGGG